MKPAAVIIALAATGALLAAPASYAQVLRDLPSKVKPEAKSPPPAQKAPQQQPPAQQPVGKPAQAVQSADPAKKADGGHGKKKGYYTKAMAKKKSGNKDK